MTLSFVEYLQEARRNPEQNPRIGPLTRLEEYKDDPNIFISFTAVDKAGLKPLSDYNTPLGVYTYPLKVSWNYYNVEMYWDRAIGRLQPVKNPVAWDKKMTSAETKAIDEAFPFATQNPYIQVIESKKPLTDLQKFSERDLNKTIDMIEKLIIVLFRDSDESLWYVNKIIGVLVSAMENGARIQTPGGKFWYLTYLLTEPNEVREIRSTAMALLNRYKTKKPMRAWNYLLRELGHDGFIDKGKSIIHEGEPAQAVFLHRKAFKKVDRILNKPSVLSQKKKKIGTWMNDNKISKDAKWYIEEEGGVYTKDFIRWESGTFIDGVFESGVFKGGTFEGGTFEDGTFKGGTFAGGVWRMGRFEGGTFAGGTFKRGTFEGDIFAGGTFEGGIFAGGTFVGGTFEKEGDFEGGTFAGGTFNGGMFMGGTFEGGTFKDGRFMDGTFEGGTFEDGEFMGGVWINGVWEGGTWRFGAIHSQKFRIFVDKSRINPTKFYEIEAEVDTIEELIERAQNP